MDWSELDLKLGIELHQQLDSSKLFCNCPSIRAQPPNDPASSVVIDATTYRYFAPADCTCEVDLGRGLPSGPDPEALEIVLMLARMLDASIVDRVVFERKAISGGSNPAGFQRTAVIARGGMVDGVAIETICLEEDAGRRFHDYGDEVHYNLDRQGIPLAEITTAAEITSPEQAFEVATTIGMILRSTRRVKRGLGTIRQDLDVSIHSGPRVELKGVQDLRHIGAIIENEVRRQLELDEVVSEIRRVHDDLGSTFLRALTPPSFQPETDIESVRIEKDLLASLGIPERLDERMTRFQNEYDLSHGASWALVDKQLDDLFEELVADHDASMVLDLLITHASVPQAHLREIVVARTAETLTREMVGIGVDALARGEELPGSVRMNEEELISLIDDLLEQRHEFVQRKGIGGLGALMGLVMEAVEGRAEGRVMADLLRRRLEGSGDPFS